MKTAAEGELIFVEKFTCKRFELDLYHPVGQLAADASGLFLWSRRPEVFTESHARRCHYDTTRFAHSLSLSVCIFMISYDRYDFTLYCVRHIHVVIIYIYIHTLYIGFLENNGSRNRKIPIWIHLAFQAFVRDTSEFSLLISSPVSVRISRELQDVRRGAFFEVVAKYLKDPQSILYTCQYTGWHKGTRCARLCKSSYIESNGESLTLDCCNDLNESTSGYLVASQWVDNSFGICLLRVSTNHWFRKFEGILHHICYLIIYISTQKFDHI